MTAARIAVGSGLPFAVRRRTVPAPFIHTHTQHLHDTWHGDSYVNVVGLKSPAQNHEQTRQVSAVDVASSLFRVPHSEQVNTPSSDLGCASESMLSLEMKIQIKEFKMARGRKLIICQGSRSPPSGLWHWQRENCCPVTGFPMSAHLGYYASFSGICESGPGFEIGSQLPPCTLLPHSPSSRHPPFTQERVLFIGTQFRILYTSMYSPAEAATPRA